MRLLMNNNSPRAKCRSIAGYEWRLATPRILADLTLGIVMGPRCSIGDEKMLMAIVRLGRRPPFLGRRYTSSAVDIFLRKNSFSQRCLRVLFETVEKVEELAQRSYPFEDVAVLSCVLYESPAVTLEIYDRLR